MLYVCVPTYNEAVTVGVLLWRLRTVLGAQAGGRDYEVLVYDDASTDATAEVLAPYARVLPLSVVRGAARGGQSAAVDTVVRQVLARTRAPEDDALLLLQADYTDDPALVPALLAAFDEGADLVLTRRPTAPDPPFAERRLRRLAAFLAPLARGAVRDRAGADPAALLSVARLFRVSVLRDAVRAAGRAPLVSAPGWAGTAELLVRTAPFARRIAGVDAPARYDVRARASRINWSRELRAVAALLWKARGAGRARPVPPGPAAVAPAAGVPLTGAPLTVVPVTVVRPTAPTRAPAGPEHEALAADASARRADDEGRNEIAPPGGVDEGDRRRRAPRRRRRGRGGAGNAEGGQAEGGQDVTPEGIAAPEGAAAREDAPAPAPLPNSGPGDASHDALVAASAEPEPEAGPPARRRRRRGGARRRGRDTGVGPADTDGDAATWQAAPPDPPPS